MIGLALVFGSGCADENRLVSAELTESGETVTLNFERGQADVPYNAVRDTLSSMEVPHSKARTILHSVDQQKRAYRLGRESAEAAPLQAEGTHPDAVLWLARAIYVEGRSVGAYGMQLLAHALINRVESPHWPNTMKGVVLERNRNDQGRLVWQITGMKKQRQTWQQLDFELYQDATASTHWRIAVREAYGALQTPKRFRPLDKVYHWVSPALLNRLPKWARSKSPHLIVGDSEQNLHFYQGDMGRTPTTAAR